MVKIPHKAYTLEFKQEAVRLVESGQHVSEAARSFGIVEQTLANWVKAHHPEHGPQRSRYGSKRALARIHN